MTTPGYQQPPQPAGGKKGKGLVLLLVGAGCCVLVVPVVGILAAIAIPNFLKFSCRAKQGEAKMNLAGLYTAERAFYGEYNTYTTDFVALDWFPDTSPRYVYGFAEPGPGLTSLSGVADYDESRKDTTDASVIAKGHYGTFKMQDLQGAPITAADLPADTTATKDEFEAGAAGDIDPDRGRQLDVWTIDDRKTLVNVESDCDL